MGNIGFDINKEFLPSFDRFNSPSNQRLMFLKFFNQEVSCDMRFSKEELSLCKDESLFNIFAKKIIKNVRFDSYLNSNLKSIDIDKTNKINSFFNKIQEKKNTKIRTFSLLNSLEKSNIDLAIKLINVLEDSDYSIFLNGEKIFKNFVSHKVLRSDNSREVYVHPDSIDVISNENSFKTKIFTFWELLDMKNLKIDEHVKKAVECIKTSEFKQVYLVYPKNDKFNKHVQVKTQELEADEYEIKLIPYSLRSTLR